MMNNGAQVENILGVLNLQKPAGSIAWQYAGN